MKKNDVFRLAYAVNMQSDDTAEIMLYGQIISNMPEEWKWDAEDKSASDFKKAVDDVKKSGATKLTLRINSPGGICTESIAMRSILANAGFDEVTIRIEGLCASAATNIATIPGVKVEIAEGSEYMIHNPWTIAIGNADDFEHEISRLRNIEEMSRGFYVNRTGQTEEQIKEWMDAETWFTAQQAVEYGFADELLSAETPIAACVSAEEMSTMKGLYKSIPEQITVKKSTSDLYVKALSALSQAGDIFIDADTVREAVSNDEPQEAGSSTEINEQEDISMDLKELTIEMLRNENPALLSEIEQSAVNAERERLADIDALTIPGYEDMAAQAKEQGTSVIDFQKQIVAAMKQKGESFLAARKEETAPAQEVVGDAPSGKTEEQEISDMAKSIAEFASAYTGHDSAMF